MRLLVDGNHLTSRCRFAKVRELGTSDGRASGVIYGVLRALASASAKTGSLPSETYVFWDGARRSYGREELYPEYKGNRYKELTDPREIQELAEYRSQLNPLRDGLSYLGVHQVRVEACEADDLISVAAHFFVKYYNETVVILSGDKDFHQIVGPQIRLLDPHSESLLGPAEVCERWNARRVSEIVLIRAIQGDPSDNITGVPKLGEKRSPYCARFLFTPDSQVPEEWKKHVATAKANLPIIERNVSLMRLPHNWDETFYHPMLGVVFFTQLAELPEKDERKFVEFLKSWELQSVLELSRW